MADAKALTFTREETKVFVQSLTRGQSVLAATVAEYGPPLAEECRAAKKPLFSLDGGATYRAYPLCFQCGHDYHAPPATCSGLTAMADRITHAVGGACTCDWTP